MTELQIKVVGAHAVMARKDGRLTTGMVGAVARFSFDRVWDGLTKVAVFKGSGVTRDVLRWDGDAVKIPAEVLREDGRLYVGVEGRNGDGSLVIPTVWVDCGMVLCGAEPSGDPSVDPGLAVWQQIQNQMGDLAQLQTKDKASLVVAINEALRSGGGSVDEAAVERIVEAYLADSPQEGGIHVGPEPPTDGSDIWLDTGGDRPAYLPSPAKAEVGQYLRVTEVDADGKIVATETVGTDTSLSVSGDPADALVTGNNIKNIGKTLNAIEKVSRFMTTSGWMLSIDTVDKTVTVPSGMLACGTWCLPVAEQTVDIVQDDATTLVVYDSSNGAVKSVLFSAYTGKTMYVIAVITAERYAEPNANWVQGPYLVDGVMVGGGSDVSDGDGKWEHICDYTTTEQIDAVGIEITQNVEGIPLSDLKYNEIWVMTKMVGVDTNTHNWWACHCYAHQTDGNTQELKTNGSSSGGTTGTRYASYYHFIRGGKMYYTNGSKTFAYTIDGGTEAWLHNYLDYYLCDYFEKVVIVADSSRVIGVDTEIRVLGRRA